MIRGRTWLAGLAVGIAAGHAAAQAGWIVTTEYEPGHTSVNPLAPTAVIRISAFFPPTDHAYASARWDFWSDDSTWESAYPIPPFLGGTAPPQIVGPSVYGCIATQIHFPPSLPANPANPIWVLRAEWVTQDFRPRTVGISTRTYRFDVYISPTSPASQSRLSVLVEGHGEIRVTPAPGVLCILGAGLIRRRRP